MHDAKIAIHLACVLLLLPAGCARRAKVDEDPARLDRRLVTSVVDEQVAQGIVRQRTVYPYHFIPGTDELNELGRRDLTILADYYTGYPGALSIRCDPAAPDLTEARMQAVRSFLEAHRVQVSRMTFTETWPGGNGMLAESAAIRWAASEAQEEAQGTGALAVPMVGVGAGGATP